MRNDRRFFCRRGSAGHGVIGHCVFGNEDTGSEWCCKDICLFKERNRRKVVIRRDRECGGWIEIAIKRRVLIVKSKHECGIERFEQRRIKI